jgi:hypothetical protein
MRIQVNIPVGEDENMLPKEANFSSAQSIRLYQILSDYFLLCSLICNAEIFTYICEKF